MTQIKNINAMQELTEVQEDMADTHDKFHNKSLKGKKGYITFASQSSSWQRSPCRLLLD